MITFLSLKRFKASLMEFLLGHLKKFPLEMWEGGQMDKSSYANGGFIASVHVPRMGEGVNFCHSGALIE